MRKTLYSSFLALACLAPALLVAMPFHTARAQNLSLIRDSEVEATIALYVAPLFQIAGDGPEEIYIVNDPALNAFVTPGRRMFVFTGLLTAAEDPLEVIGVLAHETGHLVNHHIVGRYNQLQQAQTISIVTTILSVLVGAASGSSEVFIAGQSASQDILVRNYLFFTRSQEAAADQAAVRMLEELGYSPRPLLEFMTRLDGQDVLNTSQQDPYLQSHPRNQDRINFLEQAVADSPFRDVPTPPALQAMHDRIRAKLIGFLEPTPTVLRLYPETDQTVPARYARSIAYYRRGEVDKGLAELDSLLAESPEDPYFLELRGQILFENSRIADSLPFLRRASEILPGASQIRLLTARALLQMNESGAYDPAFDEEALTHLRAVITKEPHSSSAWRLSATAYGRLGDLAMTSLALAEESLSRGRLGQAKAYAERALEGLEEGSVVYRQAEDIINLVENERADN